jgi:hypothetical protein
VRFSAKWTPVRARKARQNKKRVRNITSPKPEKALAIFAVSS